jgi:uncharacterized membrane protein HdeD (DUF308 family)
LEASPDSWRVGLVVGLITIGVGVGVICDPGASLVVLAVLIGASFLVSGAWRLIRGLLADAPGDRTLDIVVGVLTVLLGLILIRHLDLTLLLVSSLVGVLWIVAGLGELAVALSAPTRSRRSWLSLAGGVSFVAGVVVLAYPVGTLVALAVLIGVWLMLNGLAESVGALVLRRAKLPARPTRINRRSPPRSGVPDDLDGRIGA